MNRIFSYLHRFYVNPRNVFEFTETRWKEKGQSIDYLINIEFSSCEIFFLPQIETGSFKYM
jgi:hypothetical protein